MLASERRRLILERVAEHQSIEAQALADELRVSAMTIRRDIKSSQGKRYSWEKARLLRSLRSFYLHTLTCR